MITVGNLRAVQQGIQPRSLRGPADPLRLFAQRHRSSSTTVSAKTATRTRRSLQRNDQRGDKPNPEPYRADIDDGLFRDSVPFPSWRQRHSRFQLRDAHRGRNRKLFFGFRCKPDPDCLRRTQEEETASAGRQTRSRSPDNAQPARNPKKSKKQSAGQGNVGQSYRVRW